MKLPAVVRNLFMSKAQSPEEVAQLSVQLIVAAGNNDVAEIKCLQTRGANINHKADITLGSGTLHIGPDGISQPESATNALIVALHNGAFDAALYLAQAGADATYGRKNSSSMYKDNEEKPLDFLLTDHVPEQAQETPNSVTDFMKDAFDEESSARRQRNYQTDLYTPEQRVQLFDALVANTDNPLDLVSGLTMNNALMWARSEMIPKLEEIGVKIEDRHFVDAANPIHRKNNAIETMEAVLPYVRDVNVTNQSNANAGHIVAGTFDLKTFQWLEEQGLDKNAVANFNVPTYAHLVAGSGRSNDDDMRLTFAQYLANNDYNLEHEGNPRFGINPPTPTDKAFDEGNIAVGLVYLSSGIQAKPEYLAQAVGARHFNNVTTEELVELVDELSQRDALDLETAMTAYSEMIEKISWNDKNVPLYAPVANALVGKGFRLEVQHSLEDKADSVRKLLDEMTKRTEVAFLPASQPKGLSGGPG